MGDVLDDGEDCYSSLYWFECIATFFPEMAPAISPPSAHSRSLARAPRGIRFPRYAPARLSLGRAARRYNARNPGGRKRGCRPPHLLHNSTSFSECSEMLPLHSITDVFPVYEVCSCKISLQAPHPHRHVLRAKPHALTFQIAQIFFLTALAAHTSGAAFRQSSSI